MKLNRTDVFIIISSIALLLVLVNQVNWILRTAEIKERLFNEKAAMVLARTTDALLSDTETCKKIGASLESDTILTSAVNLGRNEMHKIDSLFNHYMKFYGFRINYRFLVTKPQPVKRDETGLVNYILPDQAGCYKGSLEELSNRNGFKLELLFPEKKQFIMAEMSTLFISSVVLVFVVLVMFWRTVQSLAREKKISEHTNDFLNNMTHEFKTPLTNIALAGKMMVKDSAIKQEDKVRHYTEIILEENEKLRLQVEQFLSMNAFERDEIPIQKKQLDFHNIILSALKYMNIQLENKQGNVAINLNADRFLVMGDKTLLTNVVCNLIDNAIKYSIEKPELTIRTYNAGKNLIILISDKGIGIEKQYQAEVFDKFFRVPTGDLHDIKGFGLGLAYIKRVIELHGGKIELQSEKGKGTTFTIALAHV